MMDALSKACKLTAATRYLFLSPHAAVRFRFKRGRNPDLSSFSAVVQKGASLGQRLHHAFALLLRAHPAAVIIGTDSPELRPATLRLALGELGACESVIGPCPDGGFYLIGLRRLVPRLFARVRWGTAHAYRDMKEGLLDAGFSCSVLPPVSDVDRPADFRRLQRVFRRSAALRRLAPNTWRFASNFRGRLPRGKLP
jgi:uncharacterized protein